MAGGAAVPKTVQDLVRRFARDRAVFMSGSRSRPFLFPSSTPHEREALERTIAVTDRQIDALVYELYGLMEGEIRIIEARESRQVGGGRSGRR